eukprot:9538-Heterococcus_DN1.PRE.1
MGGCSSLNQGIYTQNVASHPSTIYTAHASSQTNRTHMHYTAKQTMMGGRVAVCRSTVYFGLQMYVQALCTSATATVVQSTATLNKSHSTVGLLLCAAIF